MRYKDRRTRRNLTADEGGMVSILTVIVLMVVITLITLGFSRLANREQANILDRQLSSQAFYAAETGVNDAVRALLAGFEGAKENCNDWVNSAHPEGFQDWPDDFEPSSQLTEETSYTCLLVDNNPRVLEYTLPANTSQSFPIRSASGQSIEEIEITWQDSDASGGSGAGGCYTSSTTSFPVNSSWPASCDAPVLRVDLTPIPGSFGRDYLRQNNFAFILYPHSDAGPGNLNLSFNAGNSGLIHSSRCGAGSGPLLCTTRVDVSGLDLGQYFMRVRPVYDVASVQVRAYNDDDALELTGAQVEVDSTGRSVDVLRRVVTRLSVSDFIGPNTPGFAIQSRSDSICKLFQTGPNSTTEGSQCPTLP